MSAGGWLHPPRRAGQVVGRAAAGMDLPTPVLGLTPTLQLHASGALTYLGTDAAPGAWDDDATVLLAVPA